MSTFMLIRSKVRHFVSTYEVWVLRAWNAIIALAGLLCLSKTLGYQKTVSSPMFILVLTVASAFLPLKGVSFILIMVALLDLYALSLDVALVGAGFILVGYLICAYFHSNNVYNLSTVPICFHMNVPYVIAMGAGLLRNISEITSVIMGSCTAYYLHLVKVNATAILDETTKTSAISIVKDQMLKDSMFYYFLGAMIAMFLVVYFIRQLDIKMSWIIASVSGTLVEFVIMLSGYLLKGEKGNISNLIIGNIIVLIVGVLLNYFILDLDYSRIEKVQFEDDDYYYYVTAVPKIRVVEEDKEVKRF